MPRATPSAAKASPTSATCSSCRTPSSSAISKPRKQVADHAVIGSGPLAFYTDTGQDGLSSCPPSTVSSSSTRRGDSGWSREKAAVRSASIATQRRSTSPGTTGTARRWASRGRHFAGSRASEGITGRFAEHIWEAVNRAGAGYPSRVTIERWRRSPAPTADVPASVAKARAECDALVKALVAWPSWLFARGDLAAGGAGDESPLVFDDTTLMAVADAHLCLSVEPAVRPTARPRLVPGPWTVQLSVGRAPQRAPAADAGGHLAQRARGAAHGAPPPDPDENQLP